MKLDIVYYKDARHMGEVDDCSISLIVTSPPYWNIKDYSLDGYQRRPRASKIEGQIGAIQDYDAYMEALTAVWKECERVLKPNGKLCINVPLMPIPKKAISIQYTRYIVNIYSSIERDILTKTQLRLMDIYIWDRAKTVLTPQSA